MAHHITVIPGDGVGPEIIRSCLQILEAAGAKLSIEERQAGASVFKQGIPTGVPQETIESIQKTRVVLKGPLETPVGYGEKSANVTLRKLFETFGNIRPVREFPGVTTPYTGRGVDLVVVRENIEDLYAGIEHMQTPNVAQCLKLISRKGCEKIVRLAFEVARAEGRKKVHCGTKANIMKMTEGMLKRTFEEVAKEYPDIKAEHIIIDNCAHQLVKKPEQFDVIVTTNMNGDIISDLTSALVGGLGFAPSANLGNGIAIFEAVHGSAPKYAGKNVINPTAGLLSAVLMLRYLGEFEAASKIENSVLYTLEEGKALTRDVVGDAKAVSTTSYTETIIKNLGKVPRQSKVRDYKPVHIPTPQELKIPKLPEKRELLGMDLFVEWEKDAEALAKTIQSSLEGLPLHLKVITNRGTVIYPPTGTSTDTVNQWRCRILRREGHSVEGKHLTELLGKLEGKVSWAHLEKLQTFEGVPSFTKAQGED